MLFLQNKEHRQAFVLGVLIFTLGTCIGVAIEYRLGLLSNTVSGNDAQSVERATTAAQSKIAFISDPPSPTIGKLLFEQAVSGYSLEYPAYVVRRSSGWANDLEWPRIPRSRWSKDGAIDSFEISSVSIDAVGLSPGQELLSQTLPFIDSFKRIPPSLNEISFQKNIHGAEYALFYGHMRPVTYQDGKEVVAGDNIKLGPYAIFRLSDPDHFLILEGGRSLSKIDRDGSTHSRFDMMQEFPDEYLRDFQAILDSVQVKHASSSKQGGIGTRLMFGDSGVVIIDSTVPGSVGEKGGLMPGDRIIAVNGAPVMGRTSAEVLSMIRGVPDTKVVLDVITAKSESNRVELVRQDVSQMGQALKSRIEAELKD